MSIETLKIGNTESDQNCPKLISMYKLVKSKTSSNHRSISAFEFS